MKNYYSFLLIILFPATLSYSQNVTIPDVNFKNYLLNKSTINTNGDNEIQVSEASAYTGSITVINNNITDLTGIEAFTAITNLDCSNNKLTSLDVSKNTLLTRLKFSQNEIINIDLSNNTVLEKLYCDKNKLNTLILPNTNSLTVLECNNNELTSLNVNAYTELEDLYCQNNLIENLDLTNNTKLEKIYCRYNELTELLLPTTNTINYLDCRNNKIPILNISQITNLTTLYCQSNYTRCIQVADKNAAENNSNWNKSEVADYKETCSIPNVVNIPDNNFLQALIDDGIDKNLNGEIDENEAKITLRIFVQNEFIQDLTGIEKFTELIELSCQDNLLTSLNVTNNTKLEKLFSWNNAIISIDVSKNTLLKRLSLENNALTSIDISKNTLLTDFSINNNLITDIDVSKNINLESLSLSQNSLNTIDISTNTKLENLFCSNNNLTELNVENNTLLETISCSENELLSLDVSNNLRLQDLNCSDNNITVLNLEKNTSLIRLYCLHNNLNELNIKNGFNTKLSILQCFANTDLACIQVDNVTYANNQGSSWLKDETASYNEDCGSTASIDKILNNNISITENPIKDQLNINVKNGIDIENIQLFNLTGKTVLSTKKTEKINVSNLKTGIYIVKITSNKNNVTFKKVIKN